MDLHDLVALVHVRVEVPVVALRDLHVGDEHVTDSEAVVGEMVEEVGVGYVRRDGDAVPAEAPHALRRFPQHDLEQGQGLLGRDDRLGVGALIERGGGHVLEVIAVRLEVCAFGFRVDDLERLDLGAALEFLERVDDGLRGVGVPRVDVVRVLVDRHLLGVRCHDGHAVLAGLDCRGLLLAVLAEEGEQFIQLRCSRDHLREDGCGGGGEVDHSLDGVGDELEVYLQASGSRLADSDVERLGRVDIPARRLHGARVAENGPRERIDVDAVYVSAEFDDNVCLVHL